MRPTFLTAPLLPLFLFLFSFFNGSSALGITAVVSTPPSVALAPPPTGFHPADTIEEACHIMVDEFPDWVGWYPYCVAALRSNPKSRNATIHKLAVLAAEIVQQDALVELRRMKVMKSHGVGGQDLEECLSGFDMFLTVLPGSMGDLRGDGRPDFQSFFGIIRDYIDCRHMHQNPVKKQTEILAIISALDEICGKYCKYPAPKACRYPGEPQYLSFKLVP